jgi:hypothetical protein
MFRYIKEERRNNMKLKNNGKHYVLDRSLIVLSENGKPFTFDDSELIVKTYRTYIDFIDQLRVISAKYKKSKDFSIVYFLSDTDLVVGVDKKNNGKKIKLQFKYTFEYSEIKDMIKDIFPIIKDNGELSMWQLKSIKDNHLPIGVIRTLLTHRVLNLLNIKAFNAFDIVDGKGKVRRIIAPNKLIKNSLREVNKILTHTYDGRNKDIQVGYRKGKNIKSNIVIHRNNNFLVNADIRKFFPSCRRELVDKYISFMFNNVNDDLKKEFLDIILDEETDALFLGSPVSGTIANAIISKPVEYMQNILNKTGKKLSVYADDLTVSSNKKISKTYIRNVIKKSFEEYGLTSYFQLNSKKTVGRSNHRRRVTGLVLNSDNLVAVPRRLYKELRVRIHKLHLGEKDQNMGQLKGRINHMLENDETGKLERYLCKFYETAMSNNLIPKKHIPKIVDLKTTQLLEEQNELSPA